METCRSSIVLMNIVLVVCSRILLLNYCGLPKSWGLFYRVTQYNKTIPIQKKNSRESLKHSLRSRNLDKNCIKYSTNTLFLCLFNEQLHDRFSGIRSFQQMIVISTRKCIEMAKWPAKRRPFAEIAARVQILYLSLYLIVFLKSYFSEIFFRYFIKCWNIFISIDFKGYS